LADKLFVFGIVVEIKENEIAGFAMQASSGAFLQTSEDVEVKEDKIRSLIAKGPATDGEFRGLVSWKVIWQAPSSIQEDAILDIALNIANNDGSPFGDQIYFRTYTVDPK
jgi:hypothetical protein